jgi:hypothetical protein
MFESKFLKLPLKQMVKQMMHRLLICLVLPSKILCLISVTTTWEITHIVLLQNYSWLLVKGT